jgi:hypothetical protein
MHLLLLRLRASGHLFLDLVLALEHAVNLLQVVGSGEDGGNITLGGEVLLEVSLLAEVAHLGTG